MLIQHVLSKKDFFKKKKKRKKKTRVYTAVYGMSTPFNILLTQAGWKVNPYIKYHNIAWGFIQFDQNDLNR